MRENRVSCNSVYCWESVFLRKTIMKLNVGSAFDWNTPRPVTLINRKNPTYSVMYMEICLSFKLQKEITVMILVI